MAQLNITSTMSIFSDSSMEGCIHFLNPLLCKEILLKSKELSFRAHQAARIIFRFWKTTFRQYKAKLHQSLSKRDKRFGMRLGACFLLKLQSKLWRQASVYYGNRRCYDYDDKVPRAFWFLLETRSLKYYNKLCCRISQQNCRSVFWEKQIDDLRVINCTRDGTHTSYHQGKVVSDYRTLPETLIDPHAKMSRHAAAIVIQRRLRDQKCNPLLNRFSDWLEEMEHEIVKYEAVCFIPFHLNPLICMNIFSFLLPKIA